MKINNPPDKPKHEQVWDDFWKEICTNPDGSVNLSQIKKELSDFNFILDQLPTIYSNLTGGLLSKPTYSASTIIDSVDSYYRERIFPDMFNDFIEDTINSGKMTVELGERLKEKFKEYL